jgi:MerR family copper efflux transcriptional regulator
MDALTVREAARTTGWSPRMLRYIEETGLVIPPRSRSRYRLYGPAELQRLRTLRELLAGHELNLDDVGFALHLRRSPELAAALEAWFEATPQRPRHVAPTEWLRWEQEKHQRLMGAAQQAAEPPPRVRTR